MQITRFRLKEKFDDKIMLISLCILMAAAVYSIHQAFEQFDNDTAKTTSYIVCLVVFILWWAVGKTVTELEVLRRFAAHD